MRLQCGQIIFMCGICSHIIHRNIAELSGKYNLQRMIFTIF